MGLQLSGFDELAETFEAIPDAVDSGLEASVGRGMGVVLDDASSLAPRESGQLADSMVMETTERAQDQVTVDGGPDETAFHGLFIEFGTRYIAPSPFLRPAFDQRQKDAIRAIADGVEVSIQKAAT